MSATNIRYAGKVTIHVKGKPDKKTHNAGSPALFKNLCEILTSLRRDYVDTLPSYMSIINGKIEGNIPSYEAIQGIEIVTSLLSISGRRVENNVCVFESLLPHSLTNQVIDKKENCTLLLINSKKEILAYAEIPYSSFKIVFESAYQQALIEWQMSFSNMPSEEN